MSDILESNNGSSSMASVCGGCLALMDTGVMISEKFLESQSGCFKDKMNSKI